MTFDHLDTRQSSKVEVIMLNFTRKVLLTSSVRHPYWWFFFNARRYVSAVYAVVHCQYVRPSVRLFVRLSVTIRYCIETTGRIEHGGFLPPIPHCVVKKFGFLQKLGYFSLRVARYLHTKGGH